LEGGWGCSQGAGPVSDMADAEKWPDTESSERFQCASFRRFLRLSRPNVNARSRLAICVGTAWVARSQARSPRAFSAAAMRALYPAFQASRSVDLMHLTAWAVARHAWFDANYGADAIVVGHALGERYHAPPW
jgi:hypothetical protein